MKTRITYPLDIPPPAENPPLGRSTTFITKSTFPVSISCQRNKMQKFRLERILRI